MRAQPPSLLALFYLADSAFFSSSQLTTAWWPVAMVAEVLVHYVHNMFD
jgi:hypothetical protein